ncbi:hypothetical protein [Fulvivirga aurantia]|uniref:hypothetical protein n=1 Tax=Fulvivirga aurantia TaxID=2529383 RepID=UPI001625499F|nr:hypothetical protein [Fulvivirga aurantia]
MLVIWDTYDNAYKPIYAEKLEAVEGYERYNNATGREALIAAYDLYTESKVG